MILQVLVGGGAVAAFLAAEEEWPTALTSPMFWLSMTTFAVSVIGAWKAHAAKAEATVAKTEATDAKLAVNGHLAKLEKEQETGKVEREAAFERILQAEKAKSRAEGMEDARQTAELLAATAVAATVTATKTAQAGGKEGFADKVSEVVQAAEIIEGKAGEVIEHVQPKKGPPQP